MKRHLCFVYLITSLLVSTLHSWNGEQYDKASDCQFKEGLQLLEDIQLQGNERVLDVGCGTCRLAAYIAQKCVPNGSVVAIDNNESMIQKSLEKQEQSPIPNLQIELKDACELDYHEEFDLIISVFCLHWIQDLESMEQAIQGIARSLKPGGKFVAIFNIHETDDGKIPVMTTAKTFATILSPFSSKLKAGLGNELTLNQYRTLLNNAKLSAEVFSAAMKERESISEQEQKEHLLALPLGEAVPPLLQPIFLWITLNTLKYFGFQNADGTYGDNMPRGFIIAEKIE